jgi:hypothetical protein
MLPGYHNMSWILPNADVTLLITNTVRNVTINKGNNKITELRAILQRESQNS